jgi:hypothetical protein
MAAAEQRKSAPANAAGAGTVPREAATAAAPPTSAAPHAAAEEERAAVAKAIMAAAEALAPGWVEDPDLGGDDMGIARFSTATAPFTRTQSPQDLLRFCVSELVSHMATLTAGGTPLSPLFATHIAWPYAWPRARKDIVGAAASFEIDGARPCLTSRKLGELAAKCVGALKMQHMACVERLVARLTPPSGKAAFDVWKRDLLPLATAIAESLVWDPAVMVLFTDANYESISLVPRSPGNGFQQVAIHGSPRGSGRPPSEIATVLIVIPQKIPQKAGDEPCGRVRDCLRHTNALAGRYGTWVFVVVIDFGKEGNGSGARSFGAS